MFTRVITSIICTVSICEAIGLASIPHVSCCTGSSATRCCVSESLCFCVSLLVSAILCLCVCACFFLCALAGAARAYSQLAQAMQARGVGRPAGTKEDFLRWLRRRPGARPPHQGVRPQVPRPSPHRRLRPQAASPATGVATARGLEFRSARFPPESARAENAQFCVRAPVEGWRAWLIASQTV